MTADGFSEEDEPLEAIKAAWNHSTAHNFDTPEKAETHTCEPDNPVCLAYLWYTRQFTRATWTFRCQHASVSGVGLRHPTCAACGPMQWVAA